MEQIEIPILIPHSQIVPNPKQPREVFDPEGLNELKNAIIAFGQKTPLWVVPFSDPENPETKFMIIAGERRWTAIGMIGLPRVKVIVFENLTEAEILRLSIIENCCRVDLTLIEKIRAIRRLSKELGDTSESIAKSFGWKASTVESYLKVGLNVGDPVLQLLDEKLPDEQRLRFPAVIYLAGVKTEEHPALAEKLRGVSSPPKIRMIVSEHLAAADPHHDVHKAGHTFKSLKSTTLKAHSELGFVAARTGETFSRIMKSRTLQERASLVLCLQELAWLALDIANNIMGTDNLQMQEPKLRRPEKIENSAPPAEGKTGLPAAPIAGTLQAAAAPAAAVPEHAAGTAAGSNGYDNESAVDQVMKDPKIAELVAMLRRRNPEEGKGHRLPAKERRKFSRAGKDRRFVRPEK